MVGEPWKPKPATEAKPPMPRSVYIALEPLTKCSGAKASAACFGHAKTRSRAWSEVQEVAELIKATGVGPPRPMHRLSLQHALRQATDELDSGAYAGTDNGAACDHMRSASKGEQGSPGEKLRILEGVPMLRGGDLVGWCLVRP